MWALNAIIGLVMLLWGWLNASGNIDGMQKSLQRSAYSDHMKVKEKFDAAKKRFGQAQLRLVPYFISSHPGSKPEDMADLAAYYAQGGVKTASK